MRKQLKLKFPDRPNLSYKEYVEIDEEKINIIKSNFIILFHIDFINHNNIFLYLNSGKLVRSFEPAGKKYQECLTKIHILFKI